MISYFGCVFLCGKLIWRNKCDYEIELLCDNIYDEVKMYVILKNKIMGF